MVIFVSSGGKSPGSCICLEGWGNQYLGPLQPTQDKRVRKLCQEAQNIHVQVLKQSVNSYPLHTVVWNCSLNYSFLFALNPIFLRFCLKVLHWDLLGRAFTISLWLVTSVMPRFLPYWEKEWCPFTGQFSWIFLQQRKATGLRLRLLSCHWRLKPVLCWRGKTDWQKADQWLPGTGVGTMVDETGKLWGVMGTVQTWSEVMLAQLYKLTKNHRTFYHI